MLRSNGHAGFQSRVGLGTGDEQVQDTCGAFGRRFLLASCELKLVTVREYK